MYNGVLAFPLESMYEFFAVLAERTKKEGCLPLICAPVKHSCVLCCTLLFLSAYFLFLHSHIHYQS
jgi:hypothetical protein